MHDVDVSEETWELTCLDCGNRWAELLEVRRGHDCTGEEFTSWRLSGCPCAAPADHSCPACGRYRIKVRPQHGLGRSLVDSSG